MQLFITTSTYTFYDERALGAEGQVVCEGAVSSPVEWPGSNSSPESMLSRRHRRLQKNFSCAFIMLQKRLVRMV